MKIGILGFGAMGKTHIYAIKNIPFFFDGSYDVEIMSVCTRSAETAKKASLRFDIPSYTDNEDDIIYNTEIDTIDICTPNIYHYESAKKSILAGKNVYCEKPLAVTYKQAKELADLANEKNVKCGMVFNNRFLLPIMRAKELISDGSLGKILSFNVRYLHSSALDTCKKAGWKQDKDICGGGVLFDLGSHAVDLIYYLCGEFRSVIGKSQIAYSERIGVNGEKWQTNADEAFYMIATLKCGAYGTLEVSKITTGANDDLTLEIHGERGSIRFNLMDPNFLEYYSTEDGSQRGYTKIECVNRYPYPSGIFPGIKAPVGWLRGHIGNYFNFIDGVINNKEIHPSFSDGAYVQAVLEGAYLSDQKGGEVEICL